MCGGTREALAILYDAESTIRDIYNPLRQEIDENKHNKKRFPPGPPGGEGPIIKQNEID